MDFVQLRNEISKCTTPLQNRFEIMDDIYEQEKNKSIQKLETASKYIKSNKLGKNIHEKFCKAELEYNRILHNLEIQDKKNKTQKIIDEFNSKMREKIFKYKIEQEISLKKQSKDELLLRVGPDFNTNQNLTFIKFKKKTTKQRKSTRFLNKMHEEEEAKNKSKSMSSTLVMHHSASPFLKSLKTLEKKQSNISKENTNSPTLRIYTDWLEPKSQDMNKNSQTNRSMKNTTLNCINSYSTKQSKYCSMDNLMPKSTNKPENSKFKLKIKKLSISEDLDKPQLHNINQKSKQSYSTKSSIYDISGILSASHKLNIPNNLTMINKKKKINFDTLFDKKKQKINKSK